MDRNRTAMGWAATLIAAGLVPLWGCAGHSDGGGGNGPEPSHDPIVARVGSHDFRLSELDQWLKDDWFSGATADPSEGLELRREGVKGLIDDYLVERAAASAGLSFDAYLDREVARLGPVTDEEIDLFYARNKDRIQPRESLEGLRPRLRVFLEQDRPAKVVAALREQSLVEIYLAPQRAEISEGGASRGPADAIVTLVEFSDYQCPYCRKAEATLDELARLYPAELRIVYRHFPLQNHPRALPAAEAAVCAQNQGKFWEYHRLVFLNQQALTAQDLDTYAEEVGLDLPSFASCLTQEATTLAVMRDAEAGKRAGATATPTFFINGIVLRGARELEAFRQIIDAEIAHSADH